MLPILTHAAPKVPGEDVRQQVLDSRFRRFWRRFLRHKGALTGGVIMLLLILLSLFPDLFAPYDPIENDVMSILQPPSLLHPFGTDAVGRDVLSRVIHGTRHSLYLGLISVSISLTAGTVLGVVAGYFRGWTDTLISRFVDILLAFPGLLLSMLFIFTFGPSLANAMIAVGIAGIPSFARVTRGEVLSASQNLYVESARASGAPDFLIMFRHVLPNVIAPSIIIATLRIGTAVLYGASLSYLGLGAQAPTPEWGLLVNTGRGFMQIAPWLALFPGLAIALSVLGMNLLGDGLRDLLDPRLRQ